MMFISSETPPRSPLLIPSTSSIIKAILRVSPPKVKDAFEIISLTIVKTLFLIPSVTAAVDLFLASLAFTSKYLKPSASHTSCAELVLPTPGGPLMSIARRKFVFCPFHWLSQFFNCKILLLLPTSSVQTRGLYLSTQSISRSACSHALNLLRLDSPASMSGCTFRLVGSLPKFWADMPSCHVTVRCRAYTRTLPEFQTSCRTGSRFQSRAEWSR